MKPDVLLAGGGLIGCAVAWRLAQAGAIVAVADPGPADGVASTAAAGMLAPLAEAHEPGPFLDLALTSLAMYPQFVADVEAAAGIGVELVRQGKLVVATTAAQADALRAAYEWQLRAGHDVRMLSAAQARDLEPHLTTAAHAAVLIRDDHRVDNVRLASALARAAARAGVHFLPHAVDEVLRDTTGRVAGVRLHGGETIEAEVVVVAAGCWSGRIAGLPAPLPIEPVRGQMLQLEPAQPLFRHTLAGPEGYLVPREDGRVIVGSTEEHVGFDASTTAEALDGLRDVAIALVPGLGDAPTTAAWAGLRPATPDGLPILGEDARMPGLVYATGHFRNGVLLTPVTAEVVASIAAGEPAPDGWDAFSVHRFGESKGAVDTEDRGTIDRGPVDRGSLDGGHATPARSGDAGGRASRGAATPAAGPTCDVCGGVMYEVHCKLVCPTCGFRRDCSDP